MNINENNYLGQMKWDTNHSLTLVWTLTLSTDKSSIQNPYQKSISDGKSQMHAIDAYGTNVP